MSAHRLSLSLLQGTYAVCRLPAEESIPDWCQGSFVAITRTHDELSIVCQQSLMPVGVACERDWRCLRIAGTVPFVMSGVLASLINPLAESGIPVFAISTFDTDYLLIKETDVETATAALKRAGHSFEN